ncbi:MAG TPA: hypothetical protein VNZ58_00850 [Thermomicrobiales bacterium]|nr:hypothetical protein [Thermomicrobiales bacterium]
MTRLPQFVWLGVSIVFLVYVLFGSVSARIWTLGRLTFQDRRIVHVWRYFGDHLPDMPGGPVFPVLYYLSLAVLVIGTIVGLGLFLLTGDEDDARSSLPSTNSPDDRMDRD